MDHDALLDDAERDLRGAQAALARLDAGTYWTDEVTGAPIPDDVLAANPTLRTQVPPPGATPADEAPDEGDPRVDPTSAGDPRGGAEPTRVDTAQAWGDAG